MFKEWSLLKKEYITTPVRYIDLAKKYNLTETSIYNHSKKEKWKELRKEYLKKSGEKLQSKIIEDKANADFNERKKRIDKFKAVVHRNLDLLNSDDKTIKIKSKETLLTATSDASKHIELLEGEATERVQLDDKEKQERINRLRQYFTVNPSSS